MSYSDEHEEIRRNVRRFIDTEINPYVDEWEAAGAFPAHELFAKMGAQGYLGINKPVKYGGLGLDYACHLAFIESLGHIACGGVPMAIGVQTDMATPALTRFGSEELAHEFLVPAIKGEHVACVGISEVGAGSDVAAIKTASASPRWAQARMWLPSRPPPARTAATTSSTAARCGSPTAPRPTGCACSPTRATIRCTATSR